MKKTKKSFAENTPSRANRADLTLHIPSLIWPETPPASQPESSPWLHDLGLHDLAQGLNLNRRYTQYVYRLLADLTTDPQVIRWRQRTLADFINNPAMTDQVSQLLPRLASLQERHTLLGRRERHPLAETAERVAELDIYIGAIHTLQEALAAAKLTAPALIALRDQVAALAVSPDFISMAEHLPDLRLPMENIASLVIGVNLDTQLQPTSAVLMGVNDYKLGGKNSLLGLILGVDEKAGENGVTPLNYLPSDPEMRPFAPLFQDLERLMAHVAKPIAQELYRYNKVTSQPLVALEFELAFYLAAVQLARQFQALGVAVCQPEIAPPEDRVMHITGLVNAQLCLRQQSAPVSSDVVMDDSGRIAVLTGPNSGGKTTYLQSVGLAQALFQAGLFIPAQSARISPVAAILTHYPALETRQQGRLAEEAERLRQLFQRVSARSLVLLNETFSSTSSGEAVYLAQDILGALRVIGARAIFATHLVELVDHLEQIERDLPGDSGLYSLVAAIRWDADGEPERTFQIVRGQPLGRSLAHQIARRHGISLDQILAVQRVKAEEG